MCYLFCMTFIFQVRPDLPLECCDDTSDIPLEFKFKVRVFTVSRIFPAHLYLAPMMKEGGMSKPMLCVPVAVASLLHTYVDQSVSDREDKKLEMLSLHKPYLLICHFRRCSIICIQLKIWRGVFLIRLGEHLSDKPSGFIRVFQFVYLTQCSFFFFIFLLFAF